MQNGDDASSRALKMERARIDRAFVLGCEYDQTRGGHGSRDFTHEYDLAIRRAFESAGVEFIDENGGGPGVRLRKRHQKKS